MEDLYECECGQTIRNIAGSIATHKKSQKHKTQMTIKRQKNNMMNYLKPKRATQQTHPETNANESQETSSNQLCPSEQLNKPQRCQGVVPLAISDSDDPLLCQIPFRELRKIQPRFFWISETGFHHI